MCVRGRRADRHLLGHDAASRRRQVRQGHARDPQHGQVPRGGVRSYALRAYTVLVRVRVISNRLAFAFRAHAFHSLEFDAGSARCRLCRSSDAWTPWSWRSPLRRRPPTAASRASTSTCSRSSSRSAAGVSTRCSSRPGEYLSSHGFYSHVRFCLSTRTITRVHSDVWHY